MPDVDLVLASASPRRRALLAAFGVPFRVEVAAVDERPLAGEAAVAIAERLAAMKAAAVATRMSDDARARCLVLAADTVVVLSDQVLGKPRDAKENRDFLARLAGRPHRVVTAHALRLAGRNAARTVTTEVRLRSLSEREIERFVASGEGMDKAGGYAIQDLGSGLVDQIHGCFTNVVGLSLPAVREAARELGADLV